MEKRIELEKRNRPLDQIDELNLDNCRSTTIEGLTEDFINLKSLSLNGVGLTSLKGFPALPNLRKLEMGDNRISGGLQILKDCPRLSVLNLSNNKIKDLESLEALKDLPSLKSLDLYRNDVTQAEDYRTKVFQLLPGLTYLDGTDANNKEMDEDESDLDEDESGPVNGKGDEGADEDKIKTGNGANDSSPDEFSLSPGEQDLNLGATDDAESYKWSDSEDQDEEGDEEDEEEEEDVVGLKDIYREDLEKESDGGDYEEEEESDDDYFDEEEYDTSQVEEPGDEAEAVLEEDINEDAKRGLKRQHQESDESD